MAVWYATDAQDPQRRAVYAMEYQELRGHNRHYVRPRTLTLRANRTCDLLGIPRVRVRSSAKLGRRGVYEDDDYKGDNARITLWHPWGCNYLNLAHELAHYITAVKNPGCQDHGPTWVRVYADLLYRWRLVPLEGMRAICRKHRVRMA